MTCCGNKAASRQVQTPGVRIRFDHGGGDCVHFAALLKLYRIKGFNVLVHCEDNKKPIFQAAGIPFADAGHYHKWGYQTDFNNPSATDDRIGNKIAGNLGVAPLPPIGDVWDELCALDHSSNCKPILTKEVMTEARFFLADLPRPIVLLHTHGTNMQHMKNFPEDTCKDLYRLLLAEGCSLVLLDWDYRIPMISHGRVRHLKRDWKHASLIDLAALYHLADCLIGVDSCPYHFALFNPIPTVGVFFNFYPASVSLPNPRAVNLAMRHSANVAKRQRWNIVEWSGKACEVAQVTLDMIQGPRYLPKRCGRDVQLQQWARDWLSGSTPLSPVADRNITMDYLFREIRGRSPFIVETGCIRSAEDWRGAGNSTYLLAVLVDANGGKLVSVDNDPEHVAFARSAVRDWRNVEVVCSDSVRWLQANQEPIDVLYLDSMDSDLPGHEEHGLREAQMALKSLRGGSLVAIDDTVWANGWRGKGTLAIGFLQDNGFRIVASGYQTILRKED